MFYRSTRNKDTAIKSAEAIVKGISQEGGLFVPYEFPVISLDEISKLADMDYNERAAFVLSKFLTDFTPEEIEECVNKAYTSEKFGENITPLLKLCSGEYVLELWHGPTCAFKDMALQLLPHLLTVSMKKAGDGKTVFILVATSGDTGKAALEGFKDVDGTSILVFYPESGVSPMQKLQMNTQQGDNVAVCGVKGNFDDAQSGVKSIFTNPEIVNELAEKGMVFSSANSINWGRLVPQVVYYISCYCDLLKSGEIIKGEPINFVVPTGNFGNILAAYYARRMGLPIAKLICASNSNNILTDFINTGRYDRNRPFFTTISPSMDILISSNLERLLFDLTGCDDQKVQDMMKKLSGLGYYEVDEPLHKAICEVFYGGYCDDEGTKRAISRYFKEKGYLCDTHTAVAFDVYEQYKAKTGDKTKSVIVSTASPFKFATSVLNALGTDFPEDGDEFEAVDALSSATGCEAPESLRTLRDKPVRFRNSCSVGKMGDVVLATIR